MVHRKSEYRLQFHILGNDLRKQIWLDNMKFRESCRLTNQSHHYWAYQVTENLCECDDKEANADEEKDVAPLPPHRLKHKFLLSMYGSKKSPEECIPAGGDATPVLQNTGLHQQHTPTQSTAEVANMMEDVQDRPADALEPKVPEDNVEERTASQVKLQPSAPLLPSCSLVPDPPVTLDSTPVHTQSSVPTPQFRPFLPISSRQPSSSASQRISPADKRRPPSSHCPGTPQPGIRGVQRTLPDAPGRQPSPIRVSFPTPVVDYGAVHKIQPRAATPSQNYKLPTELGDGSQPSPSGLSHLSRTSRRIYSEEKKKCPFAAFGWNDTNKDVGDKKTYNVCAPEAQVYNNALRALKKRREDIEKFLAKEAALKGHLHACDYDVNHSSIWMSEYKDRYGGGPNYAFAKQPVTTPAIRNLNSRRCYS